MSADVGRTGQAAAKLILRASWPTHPAWAIESRGHDNPRWFVSGFGSYGSILGRVNFRVLNVIARYHSSKRGVSSASRRAADLEIAERL